MSVRQGYRALLASGASYLSDVRHGRSALLQVAPSLFARELILALRPHYFAFSSLAALAGAAAGPRATASWRRVVLAAAVCGVGWGVGQLLNDLLDIETDAVNAPNRGVAAGRLPVGPALACTVCLGAGVAVATVFVHPLAWGLVVVAVVLLLGYNAAKRLPFGGNIAHGALMGVASAIGTLSTVPLKAAPNELLSVVRLAAPTWCFVAAIAAWYLQSNYEKDRPGDRAAGYRTAATVMSVRASAMLRVAAIACLGATAYVGGLLPIGMPRIAMGIGVACGWLSAVPSLRFGTDRAALIGYRRAVDATVLCLLALAAPVLGDVGSMLVLVASAALLRWAFSRNPNP